MHSYLRAIGFSHCKSRKHLEDIYRHTLRNPNRKIMTTISVDTSLIQLEKDFGQGIGLTLIGEYDINGSLSIEHYFPYVKGESFLSFERIHIEKQTDKESYAGICEDFRLSMTTIFYLQNIADYAKSKWLNYSNRHLSKVKFSALSIDGCILLGIHHTKDQKEKRTEGRRRRNQLLAAAKDGNQEAMEQLTYEEMDTYSSVNMRLNTEDILSIVESSFMPCGVECDHYMIIGNIENVKLIQNEYTQEWVYVLLLEVNDLIINLCINKQDLDGEPLVGRRFRGEIWLQGFVQI